MIRRSLFISLIIITANLTLFKSAASEPLCTFSQAAPGQLVTDGGTLPKKLTTLASAGGSPTKIDATCSQSANISVSAPIQVAGPEFTPVSAVATVTIPSGNSTKNGDAPLALPAGTTPLTIDFAIDRGRSLRAGNYSYTVKFTVVP
ncbi:hypothetical protein [Tolypothrix sp. VBCCA 56010]|uniref:hypothetical protein n=1 Tax=Tolypothrix sp. VBCCA 56010 TaxID=3137731 RepID=UPI003D7CF3E3